MFYAIDICRGGTEDDNIDVTIRKYKLSMYVCGWVLIIINNVKHF